MQAEAAGPLVRPAAPRRRLLLAAAGGVIAAGLGIRLLVAGRIGPGRGDEVSPEQAARLTAALAAHGPVRLERVTPADLPAAIQALNLPETDRRQLAQEATERRQPMAWLTLYDSAAEDGDVVEVASAGLKLPVLLRLAPIRIAVPVPADGLVRLTGLVDGGGGGVTVGVVTPEGPFGVAPLAVGESVALPVYAP